MIPAVLLRGALCAQPFSIWNSPDNLKKRAVFDRPFHLYLSGKPHPVIQSSQVQG